MKQSVTILLLLLLLLLLLQVDDADRVLSVQFSWKGQLKPCTTLFIGTSPEFELALYTLCFLAGKGQAMLHLLTLCGTKHG